MPNLIRSPVVRPTGVNEIPVKNNRELDVIVKNGLTFWMDPNDYSGGSGVSLFSRTRYGISGMSQLSGTLNSLPTKNSSGFIELGNTTSSGTLFYSNDFKRTHTYTGESFTFEQWMRGDIPASNFLGPFSFYISEGVGYNGFGIQTIPQSNLVVLFYFPGQNYSSIQYTNNKWMHVAATYNHINNSGFGKLYLNGVEGTILNSGFSAPLPNLTTLLIGGAATTLFPASVRFPWLGLIGETRTYTRALTASEIVQNFNASRRRYNI